MIHETAIVNPKAKISSDVKIGPYCNWSQCRDRKNSIIQSHVSILGNTKIGEIITYIHLFQLVTTLKI